MCDVPDAKTGLPFVPPSATRHALMACFFVFFGSSSFVRRAILCLGTRRHTDTAYLHAGCAVRGKVWPQRGVFDTYSSRRVKYGSLSGENIERPSIHSRLADPFISSTSRAAEASTSRATQKDICP